jgi:hypothetical protein
LKTRLDFSRNEILSESRYRPITKVRSLDFIFNSAFKKINEKILQISLQKLSKNNHKKKVNIFKKGKNFELP